MIIHTVGDKPMPFVDSGLFVGGRSGVSFSLLDIQRNTLLDSEKERISIEIGDGNGKSLSGKPCYYQVSLEKNPSRLVVDLSQLSRAKFKESQLKSLFKNSAHIKNVELTTDPEDQSTSIVFNLKKAVAVAVFEIQSQHRPTQIVIEVINKKRSSSLKQIKAER